jgi:hypothetical protein
LTAQGTDHDSVDLHHYLEVELSPNSVLFVAKVRDRDLLSYARNNHLTFGTADHQHELLVHGHHRSKHSVR